MAELPLEETLGAASQVLAVELAELERRQGQGLERWCFQLGQRKGLNWAEPASRLQVDPDYSYSTTVGQIEAEAALQVLQRVELLVAEAVAAVAVWRQTAYSRTSLPLAVVELVGESLVVTRAQKEAAVAVPQILAKWCLESSPEPARTGDCQVEEELPRW